MSARAPSVRLFGGPGSDSLKLSIQASLVPHRFWLTLGALGLALLRRGLTRVSRHRSPEQKQHPVLPGVQQQRHRPVSAHPHRVLRPPEAHHGAEGCGGTAGHWQPGPHAESKASSGLCQGAGACLACGRCGTCACLLHGWGGKGDVCTCTKVGEYSGWGGWSPVRCVPEAPRVLFICLGVAPGWSQEDRAPWEPSA